MTVRMHHQLTRLLPLLLTTLLSACITTEPPSNPVDWYMVNTGDNITLVIQDVVCNRRYNNVRISRRSETDFQTCGDEEGRSHIRYRVDGYAARSGTWITRRINAGDSVYLQ